MPDTQSLSVTIAVTLCVLMLVVLAVACFVLRHVGKQESVAKKKLNQLPKVVGANGQHHHGDANDARKSILHELPQQDHKVNQLPKVVGENAQHHHGDANDAGKSILHELPQPDQLP